LGKEEEEKNKEEQQNKIKEKTQKMKQEKRAVNHIDNRKVRNE
jgi:hypothetical protein